MAKAPPPCNDGRFIAEFLADPARVPKLIEWIGIRSEKAWGQFEATSAMELQRYLAAQPSSSG